MGRAAQRIADLSDKAVCESFAPEARRYRVTALLFSPLKLVVEPDGRKYWTARYVSGGKNSEKGLGSFPERLYQAAYDDAHKLDIAVRHSDRELDPVAQGRAERQRRRAEADAQRLERKAARERKAHTFRSLGERYLAASVRGTFRDSRRDRPKAESTIAKERLFLNNHVYPRIGDRPIAEIKTREIKRHLSEIAEQTESGANACLEAIRRVFAYAEDVGVTDGNPALGIHRWRTAPRDKVAEDEALRALWLALDEVKADRDHKKVGTKPSEAYATATALQLSLLTLQRRGEVVRIRRSDVDLDKALWTIPAVNKKERRKGAVPLSDWAVQLLREAFERSGGDWAFPATNDDRKRSRYGKGTPRSVAGHLMPKTLTRFMARLRGWTVPKTLWRRVHDPELRESRRKRGFEAADLVALAAAEERQARLSALVDLTPHDLRRTGRTVLTRDLGIEERIAERILNHIVGSQQQRVYDYADYLPQRRVGLDAWSGHVRQIVYQTPPPSNVIPLATANR